MNHLSTLMMHRVRLGELEGAARDEAEAHLRECEECTEIADAQAHAEDRFAEEPLPDWLLSLEEPSPMPASGHTPKLAPPIAHVPANRPFPRWIAGLLTLAAAALIVVGIGFSGGEPLEVGREKGVLPTVELWVKSDVGPRPIRSGEALRTGDTVQVFYDSRGASHAVIAGRDGSGRIEVYGVVPKHEKLGPAPFSLTLDDAPGPQEFFVVTGARPLTSDDVTRAIRGQDRSFAVQAVKVGKQ